MPGSSLIQLFKFSKEKNSTKIPSAQPDYSISGVFLEGMSTLSPTVSFDLNWTTQSGTAPGSKTYADGVRSCNYAYIPDLNRRYFIRDWTFDGRGIWVASMEVDAMGSWKSEIGASTQFVLRSASQRNANLIDTLYPTLKEEFYQESAYIWSDPVNYSSGRKYILGINAQPFKRDSQGDNLVVGFDGDMWGSARYLSLTSNAMEWLAASLNADFDTQINMLSYVHALHVLPFDVDTSSSTLANCAVHILKCGGRDISLTNPLQGQQTNEAFLVKTKTATTKTINISLPRHPQAASRGAYMNKSQYSRYQLYFPSFGTVEINADDIADLPSGSTLNVEVVTDITTGQSMLTVYALGWHILARMFGNLAIPIELDESGRNSRRIAAAMATGVIGVAGGAVQLAAGVMTENPMLAISGAISAGSSIASTVTSDAWLPQNYSTKGSGGNSIGMQQGKVTLIARFYTVADEDVSRFGRPLYSSKQISTLSGYIACQSPHVHAAQMLTQEQTMIENYMAGGFYYE